MPTSAEQQQKGLFWALFFTFLYRYEDASNVVDYFLMHTPGTEEAYTEPLKRLRDYIATRREGQGREQRHVALDELRVALDRLIQEKHFWDESCFPRIPKHGKQGCGFAGGEQGAQMWLCAITCYLMRSYCICRTERSFIGSDYTALRGSLNDLSQAHMMLLRFRQITLKVKALFATMAPIETDVLSLVMPYSDTFVHWLDAIEEVFHGNVYYKLRDAVQTERHYKRALRLIQPEKEWNEFLSPLQNCVLDEAGVPRFTCLTISKAKLELSKVCVDRGRFIDALVYQLGALRDAVLVTLYNDAQRTSGIRTDDGSREPRVENCACLDRSIEYLRRFQNHSYFPKGEIHALFGGLGYVQGYTGDVIEPLVYIGISDRGDVGPTVTDTLARIGFVLFILKISPIEIPDLTPTEKFNYDHIRAFFLRKNGEHLTPWGAWAEHLLRWLEGKASPTPTEIGSGAKFFSASPERLLGFLFLRELSNIRETTADSTAHDDPELVKMAVQLGRASMSYIDNVVTIPQQVAQHLMRDGYKSRVLALKRENQRSPLNKLAVLRRWQSYNPKVPHPRGMEIRGGGLFLQWCGKGVVIDPGYDFVRNFYDQGFSLEDIDAIVVTHSHPDHDDELATILTLLAEWNDFWNKTCGPHRTKTIDLFLNEASFRNYDAWIHASKVVVSNIYTLQTNVWKKGEQFAEHAKIRCRNQMVYLRERNCPQPRRMDEPISQYNFDIEVIPAWHDELIDTRTAVGVIFHLYDHAGCEEGGGPVLRVGITGDTSHFVSEGHSLSEMYGECDVVVAHLGDARLRELATIISRKYGEFSFPLDEFATVYLQLKRQIEPPPQDHLRRFMQLISCLDLAEFDWLEEWRLGKGRQLAILIDEKKSGHRSVTSLRDVLREALVASAYDAMTKCPLCWYEGSPEKDLKDGYKYPFVTVFDLRCATEELLKKKDDDGGNSLFHGLKSHEPATVGLIVRLAIWLLCRSSSQPYQPKYHLGLQGVRQILGAMRETKTKNPNRLLIVAELPEELSSYRHLIARYFDGMDNHVLTPAAEGAYPNRTVRCLTGDIGLHVGLATEGIRFGGDSRSPSPLIAVRCTLCNQNNELIRGQKATLVDDKEVMELHHYHIPSQIQETALVRMGSGMVYLCTRDHASTPLEQPMYFPNYLEVW